MKFNTVFLVLWTAILLLQPVLAFLLGSVLVAFAYILIGAIYVAFAVYCIQVVKMYGNIVEDEWSGIMTA